jgi:hypothetical protein
VCKPREKPGDHHDQAPAQAQNRRQRGPPSVTRFDGDFDRRAGLARFAASVA